MSDSYYIQRGQKTIGPFTTAKIQEAIRANKITSEDRASTNHDGPWASLGLLQPDWFSSDASSYSPANASSSLAWQAGRKVARQPEAIISTVLLGVITCSILYWASTLEQRLRLMDNSIVALLQTTTNSARKITESLEGLRETQDETFVQERVVWKDLSRIIETRNTQKLRLVSCQRTGASDSLTGRAVYDLIWAGKYSEISMIRDEQRKLEKEAEKMIEEALRR